MTDPLQSPPCAAAPLAGQVAVVTGAGGGIGRASCLRLSQAGAAVLALDLDVASAQETARLLQTQGGQALALAADVCDPALGAQVLTQALAHFGRLDILINNAGRGSAMRPLWEIELDDWQRDLTLNLSSQFYLCKALVPHMVAAGYGRIVNVASAAGMEGHPLSGGYAAAKAGVIAMTKTLGKELATQGVIVNAIAPALIDSPMLHSEWFSAELKQQLLNRIPMRRAGQPEEVAEMVLFLASPAVSFSTGAVFDLSGGRATY